jgi:elongation factor Ts
MAEITAQLIKDLRERTGVGMSKCKEALEEAQGDMEKAIAILRKAGMASAVKKQGREAKEGAVLAKANDKCIAIVEVNAETDFVAKNERFQEFCKNILDELLLSEPASLESFIQQKYSKDPSLTIDQYRSLIIQTIGENILISRIAIIPKKKDSSWGIYSHLGGKILTCVELHGQGEEDLARDIAMHVAAASPEYVNPNAVPKDIIEKEREIAHAQMQGKPANIIEKIVGGKVNAYFDQVCLSRQKFVKDDSVSIEGLIKKKADQSGKTLELISFQRWMVGQS